MYLWIVLATFITLLYSYNLSVRADLDRYLAETKAEVILTRFLAQHNAVKEYLNNQAPEKIGQTRVPYYPGDGYNSTTGNDFASTTSGSGSTEEGTQTPDTGSSVQVNQYLPFGFQNDGDTISKVFCFEGGQTDTQCTSTADGSCCSNEFTGIYVVSFRQIPTRWFNKATELPNADLLGAMGRAAGFGRTFGYLDKVDGVLAIVGGDKSENSEITDSEGNVTTIETLKYREVFKGVMDDPDFQEKCCQDSQGSVDKCAPVHCLYAIQQIYG